MTYVTTSTSTAAALALALPLTLGACIVDQEETLGMGSQASGNETLPLNGLPPSTLPLNGLAITDLTTSALPVSTLPNNGLTATQNQEWDAFLSDEGNERLMAYVVRCALPLNESVNYTDAAGNTHTFPGEIGSAPSWSVTALTASEQDWVTSCVISLANNAGEHVPVSQRGVNASGTTQYHMKVPEVKNWTEIEAGFFGNIFDGSGLYSCLHSWSYQDTGIGRVCGMTDEYGNSMCDNITALGLCSDICDSDTLEVSNKPYTVYYNCEAPDGTVYAEVTTTALLED